MEYFGQLVALGFDAILFGVVGKLYHDKRKAVRAVKNVDLYDVNSTSVKNFAKKFPDGKLPYVAIRGIVKALGSPIQSLHLRDTFGVVQKLTIKEHVIAKGAFGFWGEQERVIQKTFNSIPFVLQVGKTSVEVVDPLSADYLDLETISDTFEPASPKFLDYLWDIFVGSHQRGLQNTEEMLREGSLITGIGELSLSEDKQMFRIQPPTDRVPFFLTSLPLSTLSRKLEEEKRFYKYLTIIVGVAGVVIVGSIVMKWWKKKEELRITEERRKELERTRKERRINARRVDEDLPESQLCVVCRTNPREIIVLPCGHVCLCEDCSENLNGLCPICRAEIQSLSPAYL